VAGLSHASTVHTTSIDTPQRAEDEEAAKANQPTPSRELFELMN